MNKKLSKKIDDLHDLNPIFKPDLTKPKIKPGVAINNVLTSNFALINLFCSITTNISDLDYCENVLQKRFCKKNLKERRLCDENTFLVFLIFTKWKSLIRF